MEPQEPKEPKDMDHGDFENDMWSQKVSAGNTSQAPNCAIKSWEVIPDKILPHIYHHFISLDSICMHVSVLRLQLYVNQLTVGLWHAAFIPMQQNKKKYARASWSLQCSFSFKTSDWQAMLVGKVSFANSLGVLWFPSFAWLILALFFTLQLPVLTCSHRSNHP